MRLIDIHDKNLLEFSSQKYTITPTRFSICGLHYQMHCCCLFVCFLLKKNVRIFRNDSKHLNI